MTTLPALAVQTPDLGNSLLRAAQIEGVGQSRTLRDLQIRAATKKLDDQNRLAPLAAQVAGGDRSALSGVAAIDPDLALKYQDHFGKLDKAAQDKAKFEAPLVAQALSGVKDQYGYELARQALQQRGVDVTGMPAAYNPQQVGVMVQMATELPKMEPKVVGNQLIQPTREGGVNVLHTAPDNQTTEIYDPTSPTGTRIVPRSQAMNQPGKPAVGLTVTRGADGSLEVQQGPVKPGDQLQKPTMNKVEEQIVNNSGRLERLGTITSQFKPEFLGFKEQAMNWGRDMLDKAGVDLAPESKQKMREFYQFRSAAMSDLNQTLKEMSGAAVTESESKRLLQVIADAENDGPTKFKAKLEQVIGDVKKAQARLFYIRSKGLDPAKFGGLALDDMPKLIDKRGAELVSGGMSKEEAMRQLATEFGVR